MTDSHALLFEYAVNGSEAAFKELVDRYLDLVYSTALRQVGGDAHLAQDVAQTVFLHLAKKARKMPKAVMLGGWLHQATCNVAATLRRAERRRQVRERQAAQMNALQNDSTGSFDHVAPILDQAIGQLPKEDRDAVLLRFFEKRDFGAVGEALGSSEDAARMRVNRALEKLQSLLKQRGVSIPVAALGAAMAAEAVTAAPAGLAVSISSAALASAAAAGTGTALTLLKLMATTKLQLGIASVVVLASVMTPLVLQHQSLLKLREENQVLQQQLDQQAKVSAETSVLPSTVGPGNNPQSPPDDKAGELLRLRGEVGVLRAEARRLAQLNQALSASSGRMSNLLAGVADEVRTNDVARTNVFVAATLQDVGLQTPDDALQTILRALVSSEPGAVQKIVDPDSPMLKGGGVDIFEKGKASLAGISEIDLYQERDNLDGSVDFTCGLKGADESKGMAPTHLLLHMQPSEQGWRLYSFSAPTVMLSK
jgi:RNA polymerase sigma factor (sigma-70 family)